MNGPEKNQLDLQMGLVKEIQSRGPFIQFVNYLTHLIWKLMLIGYSNVWNIYLLIYIYFTNMIFFEQLLII